MEIRKKRLTPLVTSLMVAGAIALAGCGGPDDENGSSGGGTPTPTSEPGGSSDDSGSTAVRFLVQGFNAADRQAFYYLSQGSQLMPYHWFLALEQADSQALFRDNAHMRELGYIPQPKNKTNNPDGLPIGLTRDHNPAGVNSYLIKKAFLGADYKRENYPTTNDWMGLTCAACHTSQMDYKGQSIRIDGGASLVDHQSFMTRLAAALEATHTAPEKMDRFARKVLDPNWSQGEQDALKARVVVYSEVLNRLVQQNATDLAYGHGRLDAFGAILNRVTETGLELPENHAESNAPVSFPFLWTAPQLDWVQWNSAVSDALARNTGEVMGVYAHLQLTGTPTSGQFNSTAQLDKLDKLEFYVEKLKAPVWPEEVFGAVNTAKAEQGEALYAANCKGCHVIRDAQGKFPRRRANKGEIKQFVITNAPPLSELRTDKQMIENVLSRYVNPGDLGRYNFPDEVKKDDKVLAIAVLSVAVTGVINKQLKTRLKQKGLEGDALKAALEEDRVRLSGGRTNEKQLKPSKSIIATYKARPLNGVWATAPYLHNGSVPSLSQLLLPEDDRGKAFKVGSREFDPVKVGYATDTGFEFDTSLPGNRNTGHSGKRYTKTRALDGSWNDFTPDEREALVEYMKELQ